MPMKIIIVGAGIAGLSAAVALRQAGHTITVLEKSRFAAEVGAAFLLSPNGARVLSKIGFSFEQARGCRITAWDTIDGTTLETVTAVDLEDAEERYGAPLMTVHRVDMHNELLRLATLGDGTAVPKVKLELNSRVVWASAEEGTLRLANGDLYRADLIVAADGVNSVLRDVVLEDEAPKATPTGIGVFRFLIPTQDLRDDPDLAASLKEKCKGPTVLADGSENTERHLIWYDCRGGDVRNFVGVHRFHSLDCQEKDHKASMLQEFGHYHPSVVRFIHKASEVTLWPFSVCEPLRKWSRGKIVLIGDAAHPMLPYGGQGANQALEDVGALRCLFDNIESGDDLTKILDVFDRVRRRRASRVQIMSRVRVGKELDVRESLVEYADPPGSSVPGSHRERLAHDYTFDIFAECARVLEESALQPDLSMPKTEPFSESCRL